MRLTPNQLEQRQMTKQRIIDAYDDLVTYVLDNGLDRRAFGVTYIVQHEGVPIAVGYPAVSGPDVRDAVEALIRRYNRSDWDGTYFDLWRSEE